MCVCVLLNQQQSVIVVGKESKITSELDLWRLYGPARWRLEGASVKARTRKERKRERVIAMVDGLECGLA